MLQIDQSRHIGKLGLHDKTLPIDSLCNCRTTCRWWAVEVGRTVVNKGPEEKEQNFCDKEGNVEGTNQEKSLEVDHIVRMRMYICCWNTDMKGVQVGGPLGCAGL
jgi:hypothetical protein